MWKIIKFHLKMNQIFNRNTNLTKKNNLKDFVRTHYTHINTFFQSRITTLQKTKPKQHLFRANITTLQSEEGKKKQSTTLMVFSQGAISLLWVFLKVTLSLGLLLSPPIPLFEWGPQSKEILLNLGVKCWNSAAFNTQGSR